MLKTYFKNSIFAIIIILFLMCEIIIYSLDNNYMIIKQIRAKENIQKSELLTMDRIYIGRGEKVLKKDADKYLTYENYKTFINGNYRLKNQTRHDINLKTDDIVHTD